MEVTCGSCGRRAWSALRYCTQCDEPLTAHPRRAEGATAIEALTPAHRLHIRGAAPRIWALFGDLALVTSDGRTVIHRISDASRHAPNASGAADPPVWTGRPLWSNPTPMEGPGEMLAVDRWIVARDGHGMRLMAAALTRGEGEPVDHDEFPRPLDTEDILEGQAERSVAPRISSMARLGTRLAFLAADGDALRLNVADLTGLEDKSWIPALRLEAAIDLPAGRWWLDRGAAQSGERLLACSERCIVVADLQEAKPRHKIFELPTEQPILPGQALLTDFGALVLTGDEGGPRTAWLIDQDGPRKVPPLEDLEGLEPHLAGGRHGALGRTSTRRVRFDADFGHFAGDVWDALAIRQVDVEAPGGVVFRANAKDQPLVRVPGREVTLPISTDVEPGARLLAAIEGPRIWILIRSPRGSETTLQAFQWSSGP